MLNLAQLSLSLFRLCLLNEITNLSCFCFALLTYKLVHNTSTQNCQQLPNIFQLQYKEKVHMYFWDMHALNWLRNSRAKNLPFPLFLTSAGDGFFSEKLTMYFRRKEFSAHATQSHEFCILKSSKSNLYH